MKKVILVILFLLCAAIIYFTIKTFASIKGREMTTDYDTGNMHIMPDGELMDGSKSQMNQ